MRRLRRSGPHCPAQRQDPQLPRHPHYEIRATVRRAPGPQGCTKGQGLACGHGAACAGGRGSAEAVSPVRTSSGTVGGWARRTPCSAAWGWRCGPLSPGVSAHVAPLLFRENGVRRLQGQLPAHLGRSGHRGPQGQDLPSRAHPRGEEEEAVRTGTGGRPAWTGTVGSRPRTRVGWLVPAPPCAPRPWAQAAAKGRTHDPRPLRLPPPVRLPAAGEVLETVPCGLLGASLPALPLPWEVEEPPAAGVVLVRVWPGRWAAPWHTH